VIVLEEGLVTRSQMSFEARGDETRMFGGLASHGGQHALRGTGKTACVGDDALVALWNTSSTIY
jgi:hypothetical protein